MYKLPIAGTGLTGRLKDAIPWRLDWLKIRIDYCDCKPLSNLCSPSRFASAHGAAELPLRPLNMSLPEDRIDSEHVASNGETPWDSPLSQSQEGDVIIRLTCGFLSLFILALNSCVHIPQSAVDVNRQVSKGIETLQENGQQLVAAWEETAYRVLDERWKQVYARAEKDYRAKRNVPLTSVLTKEQQEDVAGVATLIRDGVRTKIHAKAEEMRQAITANAKTTLEANESITNLLISANVATAAQESVLKAVGKLLPIPPELSKFLDNALETAVVGN
jgi:hypothetical protein